ncbi:hypothetical protein AVEN_54826-1 [Araneus ventricosus]|uniref:Uncharacterized protein n=1 Tax=Araneus ventricosus TaxID=182803 RepID=A0A4Y2EYT5_ARAVE|nr:hypothetical protein AVEN_54826-1 [Araneus ventricosus]
MVRNRILPLIFNKHIRKLTLKHFLLSQRDQTIDCRIKECLKSDFNKTADFIHDMRDREAINGKWSMCKRRKMYRGGFRTPFEIEIDFIER